MQKIRPTNQQKNCPSCGAPIVSEICAYCGRATGLNTVEADMEYPVLECKEAILSFWTLWFPMIFAVSFGIAGLCMMAFSVVGYMKLSLMLMGIPFFLIGLVAFIFVFRTVSRYIKVKTKGTRIRATVYGYMDDNVLINGRPSQVVKLLIHTSEGPRFILYQLGNTFKPYGINDSIEVMVYQNYFMIG